MLEASVQFFHHDLVVKLGEKGRIVDWKSADEIMNIDGDEPCQSYSSRVC